VECAEVLSSILQMRWSVQDLKAREQIHTMTNRQSTNDKGVVMVQSQHVLPTP